MNKQLTYEQARELKWFCKNILGTRQEFYKHLEDIRKYQEKIDRLAVQAQQILDFCDKNDIKDLSEILTEKRND